MRRGTLVLSGWLVVACSAGGSPGRSSAPTGGTAGGVTGGASGAGALGAGGAGTGGFLSPPPPDAAGEPVGQVFGHSATTLYELEPYTKHVAIVGNFDCLGAANPLLGGGMWDIAVDKDGNMVGTVADGISPQFVVSIDKATAHCTPVQTGTFPNSLTYVPAGTVLPTEEALVGYARDQYVRIDKMTATPIPLGSLNPGPGGEMWESSGDIVSIIGGGTYLTVKPLGAIGSNPNDEIVEVDPATGQAIKLIGKTGFPDLWGLGFWAGVAYGFSAAGQLAEIDLTTGAGTPVPLQNVPPGLQFWGAGVTTAAPLVPPK